MAADKEGNTGCKVVGLAGVYAVFGGVDAHIGEVGSASEEGGQRFCNTNLY